MRRLRPVASLVVSSLLVSPPAAAAAAPPKPKPPSPPASFVPPEPHDGGVINGTVTGVDYQRGLVTIATPHGARTVSVMPSTSVLSSAPGYHAISDVTKGAKVEVFTSKVSVK